MNRLIACTLALLLVLLTPASANSAPTRLGGTGGSALTVDEGCPVTVTAEQLTFDVSGAGDSNGLTAQVEAVYQMENPTENPLSVQMSFYLEEHRGHMDSLVDVDSAVSSITADGQSLPFTIQEVETEDAAVDRFALTYTVEFPAWGTRGGGSSLSQQQLRSSGGHHLLDAGIHLPALPRQALGGVWLSGHHNSHPGACTLHRPLLPPPS
ncbi:MAG: hypothetical protein ACLRWQ_20075 [Flavonifractor plautii]